ncbi:MAG: dihydroxy-acid dehydratase [Bryobacterales bacterium]
MRKSGAIPFAGFVSDPCDGRTGTVGMMDSLPYRNDAAIVLRRRFDSLPTRKGVIGVATCDKGLPAMMLALASMQRAAHDPRARRRHPALNRRRGRRQGAVDRRALLPWRDLVRVRARKWVARACGSAGGGCQFLGTAATSQVIAEALGLEPASTPRSPRRANPSGPTRRCARRARSRRCAPGA